MPTPKNCYNIHNLQKIIHDNLISSLLIHCGTVRCFVTHLQGMRRIRDVVKCFGEQ